MKVVRGRAPNRPSRKPVEHFAGGVWQDYIFDLEQIRVQNVFFEPGARTDWHAHPDGQVLVVMAGEGRVGTAEGEDAVVHAGDMIYAPPAEVHWHGANADAYALFVAFSIGRTPTWGDKVSD